MPAQKQTAVAKPQERLPSVPERVIAAVEKMEVFETMLPACYRPMAARFLARAKLYISRKPELHRCTVGSLVQCVLSAAEQGHCLDGRMAHAVAFNNKKKDPDSGKETWVSEATYMPDYKGIIDVCRRHNAIVDAYPEQVYANDEFVYYIENGQYHHRWKPAMGDRGEYLGAFCVVLLEGRFKVVFMSKEELDHVRNKSKAKDSGPWKTDTSEMQKKTVVKRALKLYVTDPDVADLLDRDDAAMGYADTGAAVALPSPAKSLDEHASRGSPLGITHEPSERLEMPVSEGEPDYVMDEPPTITEQPEGKGKAQSSLLGDDMPDDVRAAYQEQGM